MRTAIIVIHGIGEQNPFETLDQLALGLHNELKSDETDIAVSHRMVTRDEASGAPWTESFIRLAPPEREEWVIDIHEYYWAYLTEKKITTAEVWRWVSATLKGTITFAEENKHLERKYQDSKSYAHRMRSIARMIRYFYPIVFVLQHLVPSWFGWTRSLGKWIDTWGASIIVGYVGDIAIYTTTDEKSEYYRIRQDILNGAASLVDAVLTGDGEKEYDRVIIAGHSLGSVIAYDALNRVNIDANLGRETRAAKLTGLITFGSPLDKIAFFFREQTTKQQTIRRQILQHLHSFKSKVWGAGKEPFVVRNPLTPMLDDMKWVNYYAKNDPVSGHLDFYKIESNHNIELPLPERWGVAHIGYWTFAPFYRDVVERFLKER